MKTFAFALLLGSAMLVGCGDQAGGGAKSGAPAASGTAAAKSDGGGDKIGIKECDDYMEAYSKCLDKMPAEAKTAAKTAYDEQVKAWKEAAKGPGKDALATGCKAAADAMAANPACK